MIVRHFKAFLLWHNDKLPCCIILLWTMLISSLSHVFCFTIPVSIPWPHYGYGRHLMGWPSPHVPCAGKPPPRAYFQFSIYSLHGSWQIEPSANNKCFLLALVGEGLGQNISVSIVSWQCAGSTAHLASCPMGTVGHFPEDNVAAAWSWPLTSI